MKQGTMNILFFILKTKLLKNGEAPIQAGLQKYSLAPER